MTAFNFHLRNVAPEIMSELKKEATRQKVSVNTLVLQMIQRGLGITTSTKRRLFHDLDELAGTWSGEDESAFNASVEAFEKIDEELWG